MKRFAVVTLFACLSVLISACSGSVGPVGDLRGATPVGYTQPIRNPMVGEEAEAVEIAELLESPEAFQGQFVQVSGIYYQRQVVICSTRSQRSPAQWALSDGEERIPAGGMNENLQDLPSGKIDLTVIGMWLRWQGPVGCGRQAQTTEVWYLDVLKVVSPNPISIAAVGPTSEAGDTTISIDPTIEGAEPSGGYPGPQETPEAEDPSLPESTPVLTSTIPSGPVGSPGTPVFLPTASPTTSAQNNPTATSTQSNGTNPTATATTASPTNASPTAVTPSPTAANATPTSTGGGGTPTIVDQEELPPGSIESAQLVDNQIHRWPIVITTTAVITVNIASEIGLDTSITIQDASGNVIATQNKAQNGSPEILAAVSISQPGTYDILIASENDVPGYYAILMLDQDSYTFIFNGTMTVGETKSGAMQEDNDHFWHVYGTAGETVTIRVTPSDSSDLFIRLFGPNDTLLVDFHDETGDGEVEEILSFTLPETGIYSILVGEFNFGRSTYSIELISG